MAEAKQPAHIGPYTRQKIEYNLCGKKRVIDLKDIHKNYTVRGKVIPALDGFDLSIIWGEIFGVIGHSGAGKSILIRLNNLLERPTQGEIVVDGEDILAFDKMALRNFRRNIGMNLLAARSDNKDSPAMKKLAAALQSPESRKFILERLKGNLVPAF